jgi:3-oxoisoapionate decarboxylase
MRLGIGSWTYPWSIGVPGYEAPEKPMTAFNLLQRAKGLGVSVVQICDNISLDKMDSATLKELGRAAAHMGIAIQTGTRGVAPGHLAKHLDIAKVLDSKLLRTITDTPGCEPDKSQVVSWIADVLPDFEKAGVRIAIENHDRFTSYELADKIGRAHV